MQQPELEAHVAGAFANRHVLDVGLVGHGRRRWWSFSDDLVAHCGGALRVGLDVPTGESVATITLDKVSVVDD